ncbi:hypothetical protein CXB51_024338 [Gossypium anomalum]|uniref:DUF7745 domain-containing protein n=1 Tax=Gossypium anomalum TaxID=47600 RepID=A0A8J6CTA2_9ROSI|nr:hypothetical protein CXB51_024338 [Gossypium anomalum]
MLFACHEFRTLDLLANSMTPPSCLLCGATLPLDHKAFCVTTSLTIFLRPTYYTQGLIHLKPKFFARVQGNETKQLFYSNYGDLPYLLDVQVDERLFRALAQFWNLAYSCFTFGEVDLVPIVEEYTALLRCPKFQIDRIYSRAASVPTFWNKLMTITGMSEQWITARIKEKGECKCISWDALKGLILTHLDETKKVDVFALSLYRLVIFLRALGYVDEATTDLFHRLSKRVTSILAILAETFRSLGICRKAGAGRLAQSEFVYKGADDKKRVGEISRAWNKTCQLKGVAISPATTPEYAEWRGRRINDNIPKPSVEGARPVEEYL